MRHICTHLCWFWNVYEMDAIRFVVFWSQIVLSISLENIAFNKTATQSSNRHSNKWLAGAAIDGNGTQTLAGNSCACTAYYKPTVWWKVDLGNVYAISVVKIFYNNAVTSYRLSGFKLYMTLQDNFISSSPSYVNNNGNQDASLHLTNFTVAVATYGRYLTLYKDRSSTCAPSPSSENFCALFELCEVEVLGCPKKKYGTDCQSDCPDNCLYDVCAVSDGKCYGCKAGYTGDMCDQPCGTGKYGLGCSQTCSGNCKDGTSCEVIDGTCPTGCSDGYKGVYCNQTCSPGTFGSSCSSTCGSCRDNTICTHVHGSCPTGCGLGVTGQHCKTACNPGYYGYNCIEECSGNCQNGVSCDVQTGHCDNGCAAGWKGTKCDAVCEYGTYGRNCLNNCTGNCLNKTSCNKDDGSCQHGCKSGWKGNMCNQNCNSGEYGAGCVQLCGNCIGSPCDIQTGACAQGCADGYKGTLCKDECDTGTYGTNCSLVCSSCNATCNHVTGECEDGDGAGQSQPQADSTTAVIAGIGATLVVVIVIIVVVVLVIRMKRKSTDAERRFSKRISTYLADDNDNLPGPSAVYAEVDKSNKTPRPKENVTAGPSALYAEVDKKKKPPRPNKSVTAGPSALYAEVDKKNKPPRPKKNIAAPGPSALYAEVDKSSKTPKTGINGKDVLQSGSVYEDVDTTTDKKKKKKSPKQNEPEHNANPQGLVYVDVEFPNAAQRPARPTDPGERTEYASLQMQ